MPTNCITKGNVRGLRINPNPLNGRLQFAKNAAGVLQPLPVFYSEPPTIPSDGTIWRSWTCRGRDYYRDTRYARAHFIFNDWPNGDVPPRGYWVCAGGDLWEDAAQDFDNEEVGGGPFSGNGADPNRAGFYYDFIFNSNRDVSSAITASILGGCEHIVLGDDYSSAIAMSMVYGANVAPEGIMAIVPMEKAGSPPNTIGKIVQMKSGKWITLWDDVNGLADMGNLLTLRNGLLFADDGTGKNGLKAIRTGQDSADLWFNPNATPPAGWVPPPPPGTPPTIALPAPASAFNPPRSVAVTNDEAISVSTGVHVRPPRGGDWSLVVIDYDPASESMSMTDAYTGRVYASFSGFDTPDAIISIATRS